MRGDYTLEISSDNSKRFVKGWLLLGITALIASGFYSILLVLSRTPNIHEWIPIIDFFHITLVVHVDLSVFIWFMSFAGVLWSLNDDHEQYAMANKMALVAAFAGALIVAISPFLGADKPLMNNYIPVLQHHYFYAGLIIFGLGVLLRAFLSFIKPPIRPGLSKPDDALRFGIYTAAIATLISYLAVFLSYQELTMVMPAEQYFEFLFWGGGHVLQFAHSSLLLVTWLWMINQCGGTIHIQPRIALILFAVMMAPVLFSLMIYVMFDVVSAEHRLAFTRLMEYGGLTAIPLGLVAVYGLFKIQQVSAENRPILAAIKSSVLLFAAGGIIGFLIQGINVTIPAHYHGSIVGITLAYMGLTFYLLPRLGYSAPIGKLAISQPYVYAFGQLMHILGLAWSGGYGVQRKTAGSAQMLDRLPEVVGMGMMGLGGLIAIIGGILFLIVVLKAILAKPA